jgi:hypothetical protein
MDERMWVGINAIWKVGEGRRDRTLCIKKEENIYGDLSDLAGERGMGVGQKC